MGAEIGKALIKPFSDCCQDWAKYVFNDSECSSNCPCCSCTYLQSKAMPHLPLSLRCKEQSVLINMSGPGAKKIGVVPIKMNASKQ